MQIAKIAIVAALFAATAPLGDAARADPWAEPESETVQVRVRVSDLDLSQPAGADALLRRFNRAAERACGYGPDRGPSLLSERATFRQCRDNAMTTAVAQVNSSLVATRYAELRGGAQEPAREYALASR